MALLIAILLALNIQINPALTIDEIKEQYTAQYDEAQQIMNNNEYFVGSDGNIVIVDQDGDATRQ